MVALADDQCVEVQGGGGESSAEAFIFHDKKEKGVTSFFFFFSLGYRLDAMSCDGLVMIEKSQVSSFHVKSCDSLSNTWG